MREILFKGKQKGSGQWVYGDLVSGRYIVEGYQISESYNVLPYNVFKIIPETASQFTGLRGKDGAMIFEGDILKFHDEIYTVVWHRNGFIIKRKNGRPSTTQYVENYEVIGNVHDGKGVI